MTVNLIRSCHDCGRQADDGRFCEHCGADLGAQADGPPQIPMVQPGNGRPALPSPDQPGSGGAAEAYLAHRLVYSDATTDFSPIDNPVYFRAIVRQFLAIGALWLSLTVTFGIVQLFIVLLGMTDLDDLPDLEILGSALVAGELIWAAASLALFLLFLFRRRSVQLTEWMITVDGAGARARAALEHMYSTIRQRQSPINSLQVVRLEVAKQQSREYLRLESEQYTGFVSSFHYGTDLFIGWTFWLTLSPAEWLLMVIKQGWRSTSSDIYRRLTIDQPKAMREVMHAAVRQGVDMATGAVPPSGAGDMTSAPHQVVNL